MVTRATKRWNKPNEITVEKVPIVTPTPAPEPVKLNWAATDSEYETSNVEMKEVENKNEEEMRKLKLEEARLLAQSSDEEMMTEQKMEDAISTLEEKTEGLGSGTSKSQEKPSEKPQAKAVETDSSSSVTEVAAEVTTPKQPRKKNTKARVKRENLAGFTALNTKDSVKKRKTKNRTVTTSESETETKTKK